METMQRTMPMTTTSRHRISYDEAHQIVSTQRQLGLTFSDITADLNDRYVTQHNTEFTVRGIKALVTRRDAPTLISIDREITTIADVHTTVRDCDELTIEQKTQIAVIIMRKN